MSLSPVSIPLQTPRSKLQSLYSIIPKNISQSLPAPNPNYSACEVFIFPQACSLVLLVFPTPSFLSCKKIYVMETTEKNCKERPHHRHLQKAPTLLPGSRIQRRPTTHNNDQSLNFLKKNSPPSEQQLKLAAIAISFNVRLRTSDMPVPMQEHALRYTRSLIGTSPATPPPQRLTPTLLARSLKKEFDGRYGPAWHCVVGKNFGSFVTHSVGGFVYFSLDSLSFLLFKTEVHLVKDSPSPRP